MLKSVQIKNFALIDNIEINFTHGLNIITGETGAGKSIIVDALMVALGERASQDYIRQGEKKAVIEAVFDMLDEDSEKPDVPKLELWNKNKNQNVSKQELWNKNKHWNKELFKILTDIEFDFNSEELILRREINDKGTSRCFINDSPVQLNILKKIGDQLVDFHGQHEHQLLLNKDSHIVLLDIFVSSINVGYVPTLEHWNKNSKGSVPKQELLNKNSEGSVPKQELLNMYNEQYIDGLDNLKEMINKYVELTSKEKNLKEKIDLYSFELNEIIKINPTLNEDVHLEEELNIIENSETLFNSTTELYSILFDDENSIIDKLSRAKKIIEQINTIESKFKDYLSECNSAIISINEISKFTKDYSSNIQFSSERIEQIRERLQQLRILRKKYGTLEIALERKQVLENELIQIENFDDAKKTKQNEINNQKINLGKIVKEISKQRTDAALKLEKNIINTLKLLGIEYSIFKVIINQEKLSDIDFSDLSVKIGNEDYRAFANGIDIVEFYITTNKGELPKPLADVASGGEISRIMLALKSLATNDNSLPILIFDEIDSGISGRIAQKVGKTMQNLSKNNQVIAITHLPQIAALGDKNILISKKVVNNRTIVNSKELNNEEKINEVAQLISGNELTESSIAIAKELILAK